MSELQAPILTICIALPLAAAVVAVRTKADLYARNISAGAMALTLLLLLEVLREVSAAGGRMLAEPRILRMFDGGGAWLMADGLNAVPMALFAAVTLVTLIAAPRRDINRRFLISLLTLTSATLAAYAASNLLVFLVGWIVAVLPALLRPAAERGRRFAGLVLVASAISLVAAVILIGLAGIKAGVAAPLSINISGVTNSAGGAWAFVFLVLAAILRERIFPFHRATVALFESNSLLLPALLVNSHLGIFLIARVAMPFFPGIAADALPWLGGLALLTALYTAVLGLAEREPRRVLAMLITSQSSAILAGLATASHEGIGGALLQWIVLVVSSTVLIAVIRSLEVRVDGAFDGYGFMGLASSMPRLAVFFAISGLTIVGLPGTLGFPGEDLLLHGVLAGYPGWGAALPVAIALNAYHAFRLFARLFLGKDGLTQNTARDALPRERWALSACLVFLVLGGLTPQNVVSIQAPATNSLVRNAESSPVPQP
ncbi:MAG TPA: proton-conducting transporter membrane subunit [Bryobacteraceae bacterium]|nr:proton-conducting transporter membrane subunit [Bryobacteraceae bacterium]